MKRSGVADLPLHGGRVPQWLATRMTTLGTAISESVIPSLLLVENLGPRTLQSLALIAEVIHGTPTRFSDPARFSFAHGGKDRHPFPVPLKTYDESIAVLRRSLDAARVGDTEKIDGMKRLEKFVRAIEKTYAPEADFDAVMRHEHAISPSLDGRSRYHLRHLCPWY